jgi:hypothetical protein
MSPDLTAPLTAAIDMARFRYCDSIPLPGKYRPSEFDRNTELTRHGGFPYVSPRGGPLDSSHRILHSSVQNRTAFVM